MEIKDFVTYEQFGAVGDGVADDFLPIYNAHKYANEHKLPVKSDETKHYRIHHTFVGEGENRKPESITIKTDVFWGKTKFTIDDSDIVGYDPWFMNMQRFPIFKVVSDYESFNITDEKILEDVVKAGIEPGTKKIDLGFERDYPVMIIPVDDRHKVFRRIGPYSPGQDQSRSELIVLDEDGNVSEETPIMFDYKHLSYIKVLRIDDTPITINGGIITTIAGDVCVNPKFLPDGTPNKNDIVGYFERNMHVRRSNTTVVNVEHYVTGEISLLRQVRGEYGPAYYGFYSANYANHVKFKDCILTARRKYTHGTYEIAGRYVNKLVFEGCKQTNFWIKIDENYNVINAEEGEEGAMPNYALHYKVEGVDVFFVLWGCGGTNFCKNLEYINSRMSRFDAHEGLYHGKIINSEVSGMEITGYGNMIIENSRLFSNSSDGLFNKLMLLRGDYGYIWNGEIKIKDTDVYVYTESDGRCGFAHPKVFDDGWFNWYFGYDTAFPNLSIENLNLYDIKTFKPLDKTFVLDLVSHTAYNRQHLDEAHVSPTYQIVDRNGDGYVDDPLDQDSPLIFEGKPLTMEDAMKRPDEGSYKYCITDGTTKRNINKKAPPEYIKLVNSNIRLAIPKTDGKGIPNGAYFGVSEDGDGGFFGCTKFYYDKDKYLQGTSENTSGIENCPFFFEEC